MKFKKAAVNPYLILGVIFILTMGAVIFIVQGRTSGIVSDITLNQVRIANKSLVNYVAELEDRAVQRAVILSADSTIVSALKNGDYETLKRVLFNFALGIDFASICDSSGIALVRSHSDLSGDDISGNKSVSDALRTGVTSTSVEVVKSNADRLSICASVPISDSGSIIGVVNCYFDLTKNEYVDEFKKRTGCEASVFLKDERINSTIMDKFGNRIIGTKVSENIVDAVMRQKKEYTESSDISESVYRVCYSPLINGDEVIGMLGAGIDIRSFYESRHTMNLLVIFTCISGGIVIIAFMLISSLITRKYARISEKQLSQQTLMVNISRTFLTDADTGALINETLHMVSEFMELTRLHLLMLEGDGCTLTCRGEWMNPKLNLRPHTGNKLVLQEPMLSRIKTSESAGGRESCFHSDDPVIRDAMSGYGMKSQNFIITSIFVKGKLVGVIHYVKGGRNVKWSDSDLSLATLFANTLSGVYEREAMENRISVVENSPLMIFYANSGGEMAYANPAVTTVTGYTQDELKAGGFSLILDTRAINDVKEVYVPQTLQKGIIKHEIGMRCKDGKKLLLEVTSFIVRQGMTAAICVDMTELRAMEAELIKEKNNADQASRAKSEFLSNMSHEMRTPMNAIIGMTAIAKNAADNERKKYAMNKVEEAAAHLLGLINDILDMMKIEANKLELASVDFNLRHLLQKAVSFVQYRMDEKKQQFYMNLNGDIPHVFIGDDQRLTQVVVNLLSNAVKFTPDCGRISIDVFLTGEENGICDLRFEVADSGIGITPEQQKKLFQMFEQGESGISRKYGGTGLGLVISKRIVELMGGSICIESEPNKGSCFIFNAKLLRGAETPVSQSDPNDEHGSNNSAVGKNGEFNGKRLLLAEDIEINREILISLLEGTGLVIDIAENGREALRKFETAAVPYNLIFMDMQMPEMDGLEAARRIRNIEAEHNAAQSETGKDSIGRIPIIAMTANVFKDDIDNCLAAGMDDHIGKPLDINTVFKKLRKYL